MKGQKCAMKFITLGAMLLIGCGEDLTDVPSTLPVTGTVTLNGSPLPGADVIFSDGSQYTAMGTTDGTGKFSLKTRFNSVATSEGAPPREYSVTISKTIPPDGMSEEVYVAKKKRNRELLLAGKKPIQQEIKPRDQVLPGIYSRPDLTELKAVVKTGQVNDFTFALTTSN